MKAWLMDAYRIENKIVLWVKTKDADIRIEKDFESLIYMHKSGEHFLRKHEISYQKVKRKTYLRKYLDVLEIKIPSLSGFEKFIRDIERGTKHRIPLYNADIKPEQMFLYENDIRPCSPVIIKDKIMPVKTDETVPLITLDLNVTFLDKIMEIKFNNTIIKGDEEEILRNFSSEFKKLDPDVILMEYAFSKMPSLIKRLKKYSIECPINRWDDHEIKYMGGRSYWSYGQVRYRDYAVRLRGRFLVDTNSFVGTECEPDAIAELTQLSGTLFQQTASRSFGSAFQTALVREMIRRDLLVPFKEKPIEKPLSMLQMLKADRAGHTYDPKVGYSSDVAEIDFVSMFPWLIYNHNISADCMMTDKGPFVSIPNLPIKTSMAYKGLIPTVLKPFIDRRMYYKKNSTVVNKKRAFGLKWVLVSCYGYLRFREFKLGIPTSHMAICAYARETLLKIVKLAEENGFEVIHGIIDSLYIHKKGITDEEVKEFCKEIEVLTGIPISFEGIFKWIVFLPSVIDKDRPLPSTYYGVFRHGGIKARGIEMRQRSAPMLVKTFQKQVLESMENCNSKKEIIDKLPIACKYLRQLIKSIPKLPKDYLIVPIRVSKTNYISNIPQKIIVNKLQKKGVKVMSGQFIKFIYQINKVVLPEEYNGKPDMEKYRKLLIRSLFVIAQPFGYSKEDIIELSDLERQTKIVEYSTKIKQKYIPVNKKYPTNRGLSERLIKKRLEKDGWIVWKGSLIDILKWNNDPYPNVLRKYAKLTELLRKYYPNKIEELYYLNHVHHGMPDFLCYKNGEFKFIECKFLYESLSKLQKRCVAKLFELGFNVEVHKIVDHRTKTREAEVYVLNNCKEIMDEQKIVSAYN
ncbi:MAG: DNA polymerase domain-containing protein [Nanoarchaeota archaeon]